MKIIIINGPNLNLLGKREPEIYGKQTFDEYFKSLEQQFPSVELHYFQSNIEGELINALDDLQAEREKNKILTNEVNQLRQIIEGLGEVR